MADAVSFRRCRHFLAWGRRCRNTKRVPVMEDTMGPWYCGRHRWLYEGGPVRRG